jgi:hypothetical protein
VIDEVVRLRAQAAKCRWLVNTLEDRRAVDALSQLARESDAEADLLEANAKSGNEPP